MSARPKLPAANVLMPAEPAPAAVVERIQSAVENGRLSPKFARELLVRLAPPARVPRMPLELPPIEDARSFLEVSQAIMAAAGAGQLAPADAVALLRAAKSTFEAVRTYQRLQR
jgi:hypothetical protein